MKEIIKKIKELSKSEYIMETLHNCNLHYCKKKLFLLPTSPDTLVKKILNDKEKINDEYIENFLEEVIDEDHNDLANNLYLFWNETEKARTYTNSLAEQLQEGQRLKYLKLLEIIKVAIYECKPQQ